MRSVPSPSISVNPSSGPSGTSITVTGSNFGRNGREVFIEFDDVILASTVTNDLGEFTVKISTPTSDEGSHVVRVVDILGNSAEATFYTEVGFNTLLNELQERLTDITEKISSLETSKNMTEELDTLEKVLTENIEAKISTMMNLLWATLILCVLATVLSISAIVITLRKHREKGVEDAI